MDRIYFDNAATTALDKHVLDTMMPYLTEKYGNPSSIYSYGRETKMAIENARKKVAKILHCRPAEIFFTSGATESINTILRAAIRDLNCTHIISSPIEHHATLHCIEHLAKEYNIIINWVSILPNGHIDLNHLEDLLKNIQGKALVSLMHANNEIGNLLDVEKVSNLCEQYQAFFQCDMVQTIGHYPISFSDLKIHFACSSAHKFHGPKGVGIIYINDNIQIKPFIDGGAQERNMRAGTENLYGIVGYASALELAMENYFEDSNYILSLKKEMCLQLQKSFKNLIFNGDYLDNSLYTVLNVSFPKNEKSEYLLFNLDMAGICVSGGSACSSGSNNLSHVIQSLHQNNTSSVVPIRFSFSKHNTIDEVNRTIEKLQELLN